MLKKGKKILCTLLVVVMCLTAAPLDGFIGLECPELPEIDLSDVKLPEINISEWFSRKAKALELIKDSGSCGENVNYTYNSSTGEVIISGIGAMNDCPYSQFSPFFNSSIKSVIIEEGVTSIGDYAFYACASLTSITIPNTVMSIGLASFSGCKSLEKINIPYSVINIDATAFTGCSSLAELNVDTNSHNYLSENGILFNKNKTVLIKYPENKINTVYTIPDSVNSIKAYAFSNSERLTNIIIPNSVTNIGYAAFVNCTGLLEIILPDNLNYISDYTFQNCVNLTNMMIPNGVTTIGYAAFNNCTGMTSIVVSDSVTFIDDYAFNNCIGLTSMTIPASVGFTSTSFYGCTSTTDILIAKGTGIMVQFSASSYRYTPWFIAGNNNLNITIEDGVTNISRYAFYGCVGLKSIMIPDSVADIDITAFNNCSGLENISVGNNNFNYSSESGVLFNKDKTLLIKYPMAKADTSYTVPSAVKAIDDEAFINNCKLTNITIPYSVISIGDSAFESCTSLTSIFVPDSVSTIGNRAFYCCSSLKNATISNKVSTINNDVFNGCVNLRSISIPANAEISSTSFMGCTSITDIVITKGSGEMFSYTYYLTQYTPWYIARDNNLSVTIESGVTNIGDYAFCNCTGLTNITIPDSVIDIGDYAFENCTGLSNITIPNSVNNIGIGSFSMCTGLTCINIPNSVTNIGIDSFSMCTSLASVTIPDSVTNIGIGAFSMCKELLEIRVDENNLYYLSENGVLFNKNKTELVKYPAAKTDKVYIVPNSVTSIGYAAFIESDNLVSVTIPNSVINIDSYAFCYSSNLKNVILSNALKNIDDGLFYDCDSLTSITIPDSITNIGFSAFESCNNLTNIIIPNNVKYILGDAFRYCINLTSITVPANTEVSSTSFAGCINIADIIVTQGTGNMVYSYTYSPWYSVRYNNLNITLEDGITNISSEAFYDCRGITNITLPSSVTTIEEGAFYCCSGLMNITIPLSVTTIEDKAFYNCDNLTDVYYDGSKKQWENISIGNDNECLTNATIHYGSNIQNEPDIDKNYYISAYSSSPQLMLMPSNDLDMLFKLNFDDGTNKYTVENSSFSFVSSDSDVVSIENITSSLNQTNVVIKAINPGSAILTVTAYDNGNFKSVNRYTVNVIGEDVYNASCFEYNDGQINHNFTSNGVYIDDFQIEYNADDTCDVSFKAYNTLNTIATASVYDSQGNLFKSKAIKRFFGDAPTGLFDTALGLYEMIPDLFSDKPTYQQSIYSEMTEVSFSNIPISGRIAITNDITASLNNAINNLSSITISTVCKVISGLILSVPEETINEVATNNLAEAVRKALSELSEEKGKLVVKTIEKIAKGFGEQVSIGNESTTGYVEIVISYLSVLKILDVNIVDIMDETLKSLAIGVLESALTDYLGAYGIVIEAAFTLFNAADIIDYMQTIEECVGSGETTVYLTNLSNNTLTSNNYLVTSEDVFDADLSFHQYMITNGEDFSHVNENFDNFTHIQVMGMSLYQNGKEVQPDDDVEVSVPIPTGVKVESLEIYRKESDGTYTKLDHIINGNYMIFKTNHFSVYCVVGEAEKIDSLSFAEDSITIELNEFVKLEEIVSGIVDEYDLVWSTADSSVVEVNDIGVIKALKDGTTTITVSTTDGKLTSDCVVKVVHEHEFREWFESKTANCTEKGEEQRECSLCDYYETKEIPTTSHSFGDEDGNCTSCGFNRTDGCNCKCHKTGFITKLIWKITIFFNKLLRRNKVCPCGVYHY